MDDNVLKEQLDYYNARAGEYDESLQGIGGSSTTQPEYEAASQEWRQIVNGLRALGPLDEVLELAGGTGIWTQELMSISRSVTAIDGSSDMIEINRAKTGTAAIEYQCVDLFQWEPDRQYNLVFLLFGFLTCLPHIYRFSSVKWLAPQNLVGECLSSMNRRVTAIFRDRTQRICINSAR